MSIQYTAAGFEPRPITTRPGLPPKVLLFFDAALFFDSPRLPFLSLMNQFEQKIDVTSKGHFADI